MEKIDLHIHTRFSDGNYDLIELIDLIKKADLKKVAITDHDTISKLNFAKDLFAQNKIELIPGIEFNTSTKNMHILGYGITDFDKVEDTINNMKYSNLDSCYNVITLLKKEGIDIDVGKVTKFIEKEDRERFTLYLNELNTLKTKDITILKSLQLNSIIDKRVIVKYLLSKGYVSNVLEAYDKYMGVGKSCYSPIHKFSPYDVIKLIQDTGGVAVLAHPLSLGLDDKKMEETIKLLKEYGLDGIEIYGTKMKQEKERFFDSLTEKYDLLKTAGSDFHTNQEKLGVTCHEDVWKNLVKKINGLS